MKFEEASEVIKNISYKPSNNIHGGWLHFNRLKEGLYKLSVKVTGPDSDGSDSIAISATFEKIMPQWVLDSLTPYTFIKIIRKLILEAEEHEADEWLKYKNKKIFDPHEDKDLW